MLYPIELWVQPRAKEITGAIQQAQAIIYWEHPTSNNQHRTSNWELDVGCSMLDVFCKLSHFLFEAFDFAFDHFGDAMFCEVDLFDGDVKGLRHFLRRPTFVHVEVEDLEALPEPNAEQNEESFVLLQAVVNEVLERLSPLQRRMIELRIEGQEVADIARLTARSKRTVERVLQDFRNNLAALLREEE